ncbi:MAG TPA: alpha-amylase family glycosyl hydrolase [Gaiellaceae bacterium]|nr:alpha-amylase family glycosyl hydrolase [Gaiellaceae bacterium]
MGQEVVLELTIGPDADGEPWLEVEGERLPFEPVRSEWDTLAWGYVQTYRATIPGRPAGVVHYALGDGERHGYVVGDTGPPGWAADAIVYQVWVDRFAPVNSDGPADRYGGTLAGLIERLDHVEALGANTIWLNPIHPSSAYHGYEVTDYTAVDPALGTLDDFDALVTAVHQRGLRLVLDFVPSHVSDRHPSFEAARADRDSPFRSWFFFDRWPDDYRTFFGVQTMPRLNHAELAAREHLVGAARFWLDRGVDGFRLDYAGGATYELWAELRTAVRAADPECWLFGEVVDTPDVQLTYEGLFDGCLDFQLAQALRNTFGYRNWSGADLGRFLDAHEAAFPQSFSRPSFLDNHDLNRMLWISEGDTARVRAAALCQFTLAGPPIVYYGTEVGRSQDVGIRDGGDRQARLPMLWGDEQDLGLLAFFRDLAALRRELPRERRVTVLAGGPQLAYARGSFVVELDLDAMSALVREGADVLLRS